ncbi:MAG: Hsp20/alpha crystallin family protein [Proteobacteria bacterium]|nr:Hsp20/alpha crystallin family protein [Pseudomonadota bacterium]
MAKISKKKSTKLTSFEVSNISRLLGDKSDDMLGTGHEPITHIPNVDMYSTDAELTIEVEMPGVRKEDVEVLIHRSAVTIKAMKFDCFEEEKVNYVCMERVFGRIYRSVDLPFPVDTAKIKALYKNGILTISIPRIKDKRAATKRVAIESK